MKTNISRVILQLPPHAIYVSRLFISTKKTGDRIQTNSEKSAPIMHVHIKKGVNVKSQGLNTVAGLGLCTACQPSYNRTYVHGVSLTVFHFLQFLTVSSSVQ